MLQDNITTNTYREFLEHHLPELYDIIPASHWIKLIYITPRCPRTSFICSGFVTEQYLQRIGFTRLLIIPPPNFTFFLLQVFLLVYIGHPIYTKTGVRISRSPSSSRQMLRLNNVWNNEFCDTHAFSECNDVNNVNLC